MNNLIVALDTDKISLASSLIDELKDETNFFKIGHSLIYQKGIHRLIREIKKIYGRIFYDIKLYDTPNTVRNTIRYLSELGINYVSILGDNQVLAPAKKEIEKISSKLGLLAVNHLSTNQRPLFFDNPIGECAGVIVPGAFGRDSKNFFRRMYNASLIFSPGIRLENESEDEHTWYCTPKQAIYSGSDFIIVGRPIIDSKNPRKIAKLYNESIKIGLKNPLGKRLPSPSVKGNIEVEI